MKATETIQAERVRDGRWGDAQRTPPRKPFERPTLRRLSTRTIMSDELERGYETVDAEGRSLRREFRVLAYVVEDPAGTPQSAAVAIKS